MRIEFDAAKNERNIRERGLSFESVVDLDWANVLLRKDDRADYGEVRMQGFIRDFDGNPYVVIYTQRADVRRVISFRRAHEKERKHYV